MAISCAVAGWLPSYRMSLRVASKSSLTKAGIWVPSMPTRAVVYAITFCTPGIARMRCIASVVSLWDGVATTCGVSVDSVLYRLSGVTVAL